MEPLRKHTRDKMNPIKGAACGCRITTSLKIAFCALHRHANEMLGALEGIVETNADPFSLDTAKEVVGVVTTQYNRELDREAEKQAAHDRVRAIVSVRSGEANDE